LDTTYQHACSSEHLVSVFFDAPPERTYLLTLLLVAYLIEVHPLSLKDTVILAGERFADEPVRPNLDLANFFENLARNHDCKNGMENYLICMSAEEILEQFRLLSFEEQCDLAERIAWEFEEELTPE